MSHLDKMLVRNYWLIQRLCHTHPQLRVYIRALGRRMKRRGISPKQINDLGLALESRD
ncbi:MAG: hypothetical protein HOE48_24890 [Candidatus Latescibacteria bacterium]|jgi:hypothetical protein|nr:hypothetical protein [Candidatus Latescibacterota bacterium]MBT4141169.1 hypothetical protein [Candidatus Latescibacterota bacterium]MBT5831917.1 hypothetical protein [Candidatus Latescibacterota bacterium]